MFAWATGHDLFRKKVLMAFGAAAAAATIAACGGSSSHSASQSQSSDANPATAFSTANVSGLGNVVVDGRGRTVYILTADNHTNVPCPDSNGCTKVWPDLPLPNGVSAAKAGSGVQAPLLGAKKLSDGQTYPTYNGWLMYEYAGDSGPGKASGEGIKSFGGTWYVLNASGQPVTTPSSGSGGNSGGGGGY
jgi:predicted lipoprotein with Yx(FWY)xxD motif